MSGDVVRLGSIAVLSANADEFLNLPTNGMPTLRQAIECWGLDKAIEQNMVPPEADLAQYYVEIEITQRRLVALRLWGPPDGK